MCRITRSFIMMAITAAVACAAVVPHYEHKVDLNLKHDLKQEPYGLPLRKDFEHVKPLSYPSYPFFYPYASPYYNYYPQYYPLPYYNAYNKQVVLDKDAKQGKVDLKAPYFNFKAPAYNFKNFEHFKAPAYNFKNFEHFKAPAYNFKNFEHFKAPAYEFKAPEDHKVAPAQYKLPQYVYAPFPLKPEPAHQEPAQVKQHVPPPPVPEPKPVIQQKYKEVEIFPEVQDVPYVESHDKQIVHKDEPAFHSFIFIGKYSGSCQGEKDGLYYVDKKTFAYCVDQRDVFQPCPEGTENPEAEEFMKGKLQYSHHFCSINLLAQNPEPVPTHADPHYNTYQYEEVPEEKY